MREGDSLAMALDEQIRDRQRRCQRHLARLRMVARAEAEPLLPGPAAAEVREAANVIIAEAEAASRAVLAVIAGSRRQPEAETFLWVRLARLASAADEAVSAARGADTPGLRRNLDRFDALTTAIWAVQHAVVPAAGRQAPREDGRGSAPPLADSDCVVREPLPSRAAGSLLRVLTGPSRHSSVNGAARRPARAEGPNLTRHPRRNSRPEIARQHNAFIVS
jgi:hypothetical protein